MCRRTAAAGRCAIYRHAPRTRLSVECVAPRLRLIEAFGRRTLGRNPRLCFLDRLCDVVRGARVWIAPLRQVLCLGALLPRTVAEQDSGVLILVDEVLVDCLRTLGSPDIVHYQQVLRV